MPGPLEEWQERLEGHFSALAERRVSVGSPVFVLEHGLNEDELQEISSLLLSRLQARERFAPYWLLWAIYATERGYSYAGDEYWQSFEDQTPNWEFADRNKMVRWFTKFQRAYNGVVPSGPWAEHRRIIAWPITHAILPKYLQRQFARALYDLRYRLAGLETREPAAIGYLVASSIHDASTRFVQFLEQEELTGRIVLALLHGSGTNGGVEPVYRPTLERIVSDLEGVRHARGWLSETQRVVRDRFKGIGHGAATRQQPTREQGGQTGRPAPSFPGITPSLLLRYDGGGNWSLILQVPGMASVAALSPDIRQFLKRTRCRINGADDAKPAGWVLSGNRKALLKSWPDPQKPLIEFESVNAAVDHLLESECRLRAGPVWLFRIGRDGIAREIISRVVRPAHHYIIATTGQLPELPGDAIPCTVRCDGIKAVRLAVPASITNEFAEWLRALGLEPARTVHVWPAGLPGRNWDGEGRAEWLTTETPVLGITHDHPVKAFLLSLDDGENTVISAQEPGHPVFVQLPQLPAGKHILTVTAQRAPFLQEAARAPPAEGFLELTIREPEPWTPGVASHKGLIVTLDPSEPDLDTFWENDVDLTVLGPESRHAHCAVSLENTRGEEIFSDAVAGLFELPITSQVWRRKFAHFVSREECAWRYLEAAAGTLSVKGEDLGEFVLRFERELKPVRWVLRQDHGALVIRLIDDTGLDQTDLKCMFFAMERPMTPIRLNPRKFSSGETVAAPGGLFAAQHGKLRDTIVVSTGLSAEGLRGLGVSPALADMGENPAQIETALRRFGLWRSARLAGFLTGARRKAVLDAFLAAIYESICGAHWMRAETSYLAGPASEHTVGALQRAVFGRSGFAAVLRRDAAQIGIGAAADVERFIDLARRYRVCDDPALCRLALSLASEPHRVRRVFRDDFTGLLQRITDRAALLRGARLVTLLCTHRDHKDLSEPVARRQWP